MEYKDLLEYLINNNLTISSMESLTGGMFSSTFASIPNASKAFLGGVVTYNNQVKESFGVSKKIIETYGAISKECANKMALQASILFDSDISVSFTGNAGPSESENKPVGLCYIGIKIKDELSVYELHLKGTRNSIRKQCVDFAFEKLIEYFQKNS